MNGDTHFTQEETMVMEIRKGNEKALSDLYKTLYHRLLYFTDQLINDPQQAHTIVSESFMTLWKLKENLPTIEDFRAFLYRFCRNQAYNFNSRDIKKRGKEILAEDIQEYIKDVSLDDTFANQINRAEIMYELDQAIESLPDRQKEVIRLLLMNKNSVEIGELLNISASSVRSSREMGIQSIKRHLLKKQLLTALCVEILVELNLW